MNVYKFNCVVWVASDSADEALKHLHEEVDYHFGRDNSLIALESDAGVLEDSNHDA